MPKHTTAIICFPGASVRPKHRLETSDSCMHIRKSTIRWENTWTSRKRRNRSASILHLLTLLVPENLYAQEFLQGGFHERSNSEQNYPEKEVKCRASASDTMPKKKF